MFQVWNEFELIFSDEQKLHWVGTGALEQTQLRWNVGSHCEIQLVLAITSFKMSRYDRLGSAACRKLSQKFKHVERYVIR